MTRARALALAGVLSLALISGCGSHSDTSSTPSSTATTPPPPASIKVFAASSLKKTFTDIGEQFKKDNPGSSVEFNFAAASDLVNQLTKDNAQADVFASADPKSMDTVAKAGLLEGAPVNFASNALTIVTAPGNPKHIATLQDLVKPGVRVVLCNKEASCGPAAQKAIAAANLKVVPVSEEASAKDVLNKVTANQADAGIVYGTDAAPAGAKVTVVSFQQPPATAKLYPIAVLKAAKNQELAKKFVAAVTGDVGQQRLSAAGLAKP